MRRFFEYLGLFYRLHGKPLLLVPVLMALVAIFDALALSMVLPIIEEGTAESFISRNIFDVMQAIGLEYTFINKLALLVLLFLLRSTMTVLRDAFIYRLTAHLIVQLRVEYLKKLFAADYQYYAGKDAGFIQNAFMNEFAYLSTAFRMLAQVLSALAVAGVYGVYVLFLDPSMTVAVLLIGTPLVFFGLWFNRHIRNLSTQTSARMGALQGVLMQCLHHFKYLKATESCRPVMKKMDTESEMVSTLQFRQQLLQTLATNMFLPLSILLLSALLYYRVEMDGVPLKEAGFTFFLMKRFLDQILGVQQNYRRFLAAHGSIGVFRAFDRELSENDEDLTREGIAPDFEQPLVFEKVSFAYGNGNEAVLREVDLTVQPRQTVAFVGMSGSGKSTLVTLLTGILCPSSGRIRLGENDFARIDQGALRRQIGYVTQESVVLNDSVADNISLWDETVRPEAIERACEQAHIADVIRAMPQQFETLLGENGVRVSGGQRQRISIARELCKDARMLIFDEATSALDSETEAQIQRNIDEFRGEKTVVLIAHRLSTVRNSDVIHVLKDGCIVESGSWEELVARGGEFARMLRFQSDGPRDEPPMDS